MSDRLLSIVTFGSTLGCGLAAGVFFAFSTFVMKALGRLSPAQGIAAMQSINVAAINAPFMAALFGTAAAFVVLAVVSVLDRHRPESGYWLAGALLYLAGVVVVTGVANVPRNNALAAVDPASGEGARLWADYLVTWTRWNHVRTATALAAAAALMMALQSARGVTGGR
jgi:uncharacterized membrane protein